jgi:hypothetical protein
MGWPNYVQEIIIGIIIVSPWPTTGTAAPLVAGVAALIRALRPDLSAGEVIALLNTTARDLGEAGCDETLRVRSGRCPCSRPSRGTVCVCRPAPSDTRP